jgi:hypothetical protein
VTYVPGDHWKICEVCGFKYRASQTSRRWDGLFVCSEDFETRHPQDFVRGRLDHQNVPNPRPEPPLNFIGVTEPLFVEILDRIPLLTEDGQFITVDG